MNPDSYAKDYTIVFAHGMLIFFNDRSFCFNFFNLFALCFQWLLIVRVLWGSKRLCLMVVVVKMILTGNNFVNQKDQHVSEEIA
jgi:hypothetical protein